MIPSGALEGAALLTITFFGVLAAAAYVRDWVATWQEARRRRRLAAVRLSRRRRNAVPAAAAYVSIVPETSRFADGVREEVRRVVRHV